VSLSTPPIHQAANAAAKRFFLAGIANPPRTATSRPVYQ